MFFGKIFFSLEILGVCFIMKILFLNTADTAGGAAIAAMRIADALEKYHEVETRFLVSEKFSSKRNVIQTRRGFWWFVEKSLNRVLQMCGVQYDFIPISSARIMKEAETFSPDVIFLHNVHGGYVDFRTLYRLIQQFPVCATMHDMWFFTGHCGYFGACEKWKEQCDNCPDLEAYPPLGRDTARNYLDKKKEIFWDDSSVFKVAPSEFLQKTAEMSAVCNEKVCCIPHGIDLGKYFPAPINKKNRDEDIITVGFSAVSLEDKRKGADLLKKSLRIVDRLLSCEIQLLLAGNGGFSCRYENIKIRHSGLIPSDQLPDFYRSIDLFLFPTRSDIFGLVALEAISSGTPVIAYNVDAVGEIVKDGESGCLITPFDTQDFAEKTVALIGDEDKRQRISISARKYAERFFSDTLMAEKYIDLFRKMTQNITEN